MSALRRLDEQRARHVEREEPDARAVVDRDVGADVELRAGREPRQRRQAAQPRGSRAGTARSRATPRRRTCRPAARAAAAARARRARPRQWAKRTSVPRLRLRPRLVGQRPRAAATSSSACACRAASAKSPGLLMAWIVPQACPPPPRSPGRSARAGRPAGPVDEPAPNRHKRAGAATVRSVSREAGRLPTLGGGGGGGARFGAGGSGCSGRRRASGGERGPFRSVRADRRRGRRGLRDRHLVDRAAQRHLLDPHARRSPTRPA